jgi:UDP-glucose:(heptosyl)LPS alpha-1,3-glucosyltransferase
VKLAFALYKYFPFGGLQRDFFRIAQECHSRGHDIRVYAFAWQGDIPDWLELQLIPKKGLSSQAKNKYFTAQVKSHIAKNPVDVLVGFNKMPNLDVYYAADGCYEHRVTELYGKVYRMGSRYKHFHSYENAVFGEQSNTEILMISDLQKPIFQNFYHTQSERLHMLPPGIARDRIAPENADEIRADFRREFNVAGDEKILLMVGSGFKTKGVDRSVNAWARLPIALRNKTRLFVIGQDNPKSILRQVKKLGLRGQFTVFAGRDDVPRFLLGSDLLLHPARHENTGTVLVESLVAGLPVLATDVCGYAHYIQDADMGAVLASPFSEAMLERNMQVLLEQDLSQWDLWRERGKQFSQSTDVYGMPEVAAEKIIEVAQGESS